jgi:hypothetical protein
MTAPDRQTIPGASFAFQVVHPGSPILRIRYRRGVGIDPYGFPDWIPYARVLVELALSSPDLGMDEARVVDLLTANEVAAGTGDPLWMEEVGGGTPAGWTWAQLGMTRRIALVPIELHAAFRHLGGVSTGTADRRRRGLPVGDGTPPTMRLSERLSDEAVTKIETHLGYSLPSAYRDFLSRTNGARPGIPAVHPDFGFVADQPFLGVARQDWMQDLVYANGYFRDRLTADWLAVGYVQGGLIAVRVRGGDEGSVWYWDDDDPRGRATYTAEDVCSNLLHRVADDFVAFWLALRDVPESLRALAASNAANGQAAVVTEDRLGSALPAARRAS